MNDFIVVKGAKEHNLKNVNLEIPRNKLIVFTGVSGSGKSSLAFDTIYAEGKRRYMESLSAYARQFLGNMEKPKVDSIDGLSPSISIDQKTTSKNPRSTVGTITEIYDYLRLLFSKIGIAHCYKCGKKVASQTIDQIVEEILKFDDNTKILLLSPIVRQKKGEFQKVFDDFKKQGFARIIVDDISYDLSEDIVLNKNKKHDLNLVVDRLVMPCSRTRLADGIEIATKFSQGLVEIKNVDLNEKTPFSLEYCCPNCGVNIEKPTHRTFSFNTIHGACQACGGLGSILRVNENFLIVNPSLPIHTGILIPSWHFRGDETSNEFFNSLAKFYSFDLDTPISKLPSDIIRKILYEQITLDIVYKKSNVKKVIFKGFANEVQYEYENAKSFEDKMLWEKYMQRMNCDKCNGTRLKKESLCFKICGMNISEMSNMSIFDLLNFFKETDICEHDLEIAEGILIEIKKRLKFLIDVGLPYLTLARQSTTLSGGEAQRIRLATQIGSNLTGVLYILDEPSIGLHPSDNEKLIKTLKDLKNLGNTLIVVEHDDDMINAADHIVDFGPNAGRNGGEVLCHGTVSDIKACETSLTGMYLSKTREITFGNRRKSKTFLEVIGANENNLKNISVKIPLDVMTAVTGVSGSGKSTLVNEIIYKSLSKVLNNARQVEPGKHKEIKGFENLTRVVSIDQSPIGKTPRSNPATYTGVFTNIRDLFATTSDAKVRGYTKKRFSFNVEGGRCSKCKGDGLTKIEMNFLPDVYVECEACRGKRYNQETLEVKYKSKSIYDVLEMTVAEGVEFFSNIPKIHHILNTLMEVGLDYIRIGQPSTTLSGGEAQRVKLASELGRPNKNGTIYILDEPTTGLHIADVDNLVSILQKLVDAGNTVLLIEHNLDLIKVCDYIIDIGPGGGQEGGHVVTKGAPEEIVLCHNSVTGKYLKKYLEK